MFDDSLETLYNRLRGAESGEALVVMESGETLVTGKADDRFSESKTLFNFFSQASVGKTPVGSDISIQIPVQNEKVELSFLSEGEKKMILIGAMLEACSDEKTLLLLDEPDAHIHEGRKQDLLRMLLNRTYSKSQIVMTTHSPGLVHKALSEENAQVIWMRGNNGITDASDEASLFKDMDAEEFYQFWGVIGAIDRPLALFEGSSDVKFIRKAIELLNASLDVDFLSAGGSGSAKDFLASLLKMFPHRRMLMFFDHDEAGRTGARGMTKFLFQGEAESEEPDSTEPTPEQIVEAKPNLEKKYGTLSVDNVKECLSRQKATKKRKQKEIDSGLSAQLTLCDQFKDPDTSCSLYPDVSVHFIPPISSEGDAPKNDFQIEDYFDYSIICGIVEQKIQEISVSTPKAINSLPNLNLKEIVKDALKDERKMRELTKENVEGFKVLLNKILSLTS